MKKTKIHIIIISLLISLTIAISLPATFAQQQPVDVKCVEEMRPFMQQKSKEFREYLTAHFQNKSTNTSLLDLALKRFQKYKKELMDKITTFFPQAGLEQFTETVQTIKCLAEVRKEINLSESLMKDFYRKTASIKTSSAFMNKLKQVNDKLRKLNERMMNLQGKWENLMNKIPCFLSKCLR